MLDISILTPLGEARPGSRELYIQRSSALQHRLEEGIMILLSSSAK